MKIEIEILLWYCFSLVYYCRYVIKMFLHPEITSAWEK